MTIRAVFFDVGGVLVDETRIYTEWAAWLGVSPFTFFTSSTNSTSPEVWNLKSR